MAHKFSSCLQLTMLFKNPAHAGFLLLLLLGFALTAHQVQLENVVRRELVAPPPGIEHFHFGFRAPMADIFWVRAIQDFDFCEKQIEKNVCSGKSWLYQILNMVVTLDPDFRMAYSAGAMALSVIVSDREGATALLEKGVQKFPSDWVLAYKAAYHSIYEEHDLDKGARLMRVAAQSGAPQWVYALSGRLFSEAGRREMAERVLAEMQTLGIDDRIQERLKEKLQQKVKNFDLEPADR